MEASNSKLPNDGIHPGFSREAYDALPFVNYSTIEKMKDTPAHCREYMLNPRKGTKALYFGTAAHCAILEPEKFNSTYVCAPTVDRRTKEGKETWAKFVADNPDKEYLEGKGEYDLCLAVAAAVNKHPLARELLSSPGFNEVCAVWTQTHTVGGLQGHETRCKCLIDRFTRYAGVPVVFDLKTADDASPAGFAKAVYNYGYHERAAYYLDGLNSIASCRRRWLWIVIEKERPYAVATYEPDEEMLQDGRERANEHLEKFVKCRASGIWPGYSENIVSLGLPNFARRSQ